MNTAFNLLPWRERLRWQSLRRWRWGLALSLLGSLWGVYLLDQWLAVHGVQIEHMVWREQHLQLAGWAVSAAHVQLWQDQLQAQRSDWQPAVWREVSGWGVRQHRFGLSWRIGGWP